MLELTRREIAVTARKTAVAIFRQQVQESCFSEDDAGGRQGGIAPLAEVARAALIDVAALQKDAAGRAAAAARTQVTGCNW